MDDIELLSISQQSIRHDESGLRPQLSLDQVHHELEAMVQAQRINRQDEQGRTDNSDPSVIPEPHSYLTKSLDTGDSDCSRYLMEDSFYL